MSCGMSNVFNVVYPVFLPLQRDIRSGTFYQYEKLHLPPLQPSVDDCVLDFCIWISGRSSRTPLWAQFDDPRVPAHAHHRPSCHRASAYSAPTLTRAHRHHRLLLKVSWKLALQTPAPPAQPSPRRQTMSRPGHPPESAVPRTLVT